MDWNHFPTLFSLRKSVELVTWLILTLFHAFSCGDETYDFIPRSCLLHPWQRIWNPLFNAPCFTLFIVMKLTADVGLHLVLIYNLLLHGNPLGSFLLQRGHLLQLYTVIFSYPGPLSPTPTKKAKRCLSVEKKPLKYHFHSHSTKLSFFSLCFKQVKVFSGHLWVVKKITLGFAILRSKTECSRMWGLLSSIFVYGTLTPKIGSLGKHKAFYGK